MRSWGGGDRGWESCSEIFAIKVCSSGIGMSSNTTHDPPRTAGGGNWAAVAVSARFVPLDCKSTPDTLGLTLQDSVCL